MNTNTWRKKIVWLALLLGSCVEPYDLPESAITQDFLVVDGGVNVGGGSSTVILSRTQNLDDPGLPLPETMAQVQVETEQNQVFPLQEVGNGRYTASGLNLDFNQRYRLRIQTRNGKGYLSEFVSAVPTPEIDSLGWHVEREGVLVKVNTHDPQNNTRFYRWEFEETYQYTAGANSSYIYQDNVLLLREEDIYTCWKSDPSTNILVGSTARLSQDVVRDFPLVFHPGQSITFRVGYSILVKQYAITREEFEYWEMLKKNTESVGTLFDAQPSQVTGNLKSTTDAGEPVLGYFNAYSQREKRLFIKPFQLAPYKFRSLGYRCELDTVERADINMRYGGSAIVQPIYSPFGSLIAATMTSSSCVDCRTWGGTTAKPSFWE